MSLECPNCKLISPNEAQRCDCGYDFQKKTVEKPYYKQELPKAIKIFLVFFIVWNFLSVIAIRIAIHFFKPHWLGICFCFFWAAAVYGLYAGLTRKENWARIILGILTLPIGAILLFSREARLYCRQLDNSGDTTRSDSPDSGYPDTIEQFWEHHNYSKRQK